MLERLPSGLRVNKLSSGLPDGHQLSWWIQVRGRIMGERNVLGKVGFPWGALSVQETCTFRCSKTAPGVIWLSVTRARGHDWRPE